MKKILIGAAAALAVGAGGVNQLHEGGNFNPYEVIISVEEYNTVVTDKKRVCTFKPQLGSDVWKKDYFKVIAPKVVKVKDPGDLSKEIVTYPMQEAIFRVPFEGRPQNVYAACGPEGVDLSTVLLPLGVDNLLVQACPAEGEGSDCDLAYIYEGVPLLKKMNRKF